MGLDVLIEAIDEVRYHDRRAHLVIGGRGPLEAELRRRIRSVGLQQHVTLAGYIPEDVLPLYYQCADLFVLPSIDLEGFGLVTLESLACGTPVMATRTGANAELLEELGDHYLVDAPTGHELAKGILRFFDERATDPALRRDCRRYVEARYSWSRHAERLTALWEAVLDREERA
jgi:glycosyltransferase involved in cell wall biosynthesis